MVVSPTCFRGDGWVVSLSSMVDKMDSSVKAIKRLSAWRSIHVSLVNLAVSCFSSLVDISKRQSMLTGVCNVSAVEKGQA